MKEPSNGCRARHRDPRLVVVSIVAFGMGLALAGCGDTSNGPGGVGSNQARFTFDCNLGGIPGALSLDVEAIGASGVTWGSGPNPDITGVIGTGDFIYYTTGTLALPDRTYSILGENQFADLTSSIPGDRLTVEWQLWEGGLTMIWDWFGSAIPYPCQLTGSSFL
ncbi:MAG: hypothetical protein AAF436_22515 [Myxococcota bacterium]